jgi:hypothetical protein
LNPHPLTLPLPLEGERSIAFLESFLLRATKRSGLRAVRGDFAVLYRVIDIGIYFCEQGPCHGLQIKNHEISNI